MKVYVAAASSEIERAELWIDRLRSMGVTVVSTWCANIRQVAAERLNGDILEAGNPVAASVEDRRGWALRNTIEIMQADVFWMLVPSKDVFSHGAYFELAFAYACIPAGLCREGDSPLYVFASGGDQRYVFVALADQLHETDEAAFKAILNHAMTSSSIGTDEFARTLLDGLTPAELDKLEHRYAGSSYALARINFAREQMQTEQRFNVDVCMTCGSPVEGTHACPGVPDEPETMH